MVLVVALGLACLGAAVGVVVVDDGQNSDSGDPGHARATLSATPAAPSPRPYLIPGTGEAIAIPDVGLDAKLDNISFEGNVLDPPSDVSRAGLWAEGAPLAAEGTQPTVIAGHVSDNSDRPGAFHKLWDVKDGMIAVTRDADGKVRRWRAVKEEVFAKDALPRSAFLAGSERYLRLITCAARKSYGNGNFHYQDNLVVTFVPVNA